MNPFLMCSSKDVLSCSTSQGCAATLQPEEVVFFQTGEAACQGGPLLTIPTIPRRRTKASLQTVHGSVSAALALSKGSQTVQKSL